MKYFIFLIILANSCLLGSEEKIIDNYRLFYGTVEKENNQIGLFKVKVGEEIKSGRSGPISKPAPIASQDNAHDLNFRVLVPIDEKSKLQPIRLYIKKGTKIIVFILTDEKWENNLSKGIKSEEGGKYVLYLRNEIWKKNTDTNEQTSELKG